MVLISVHLVLSCLLSSSLNKFDSPLLIEACPIRGTISRVIHPGAFDHSLFFLFLSSISYLIVVASARGEISSHQLMPRWHLLAIVAQTATVTPVVHTWTLILPLRLRKLITSRDLSQIFSEKQSKTLSRM